MKDEKYRHGTVGKACSALFAEDKTTYIKSQCVSGSKKPPGWIT